MNKFFTHKFLLILGILLLVLFSFTINSFAGMNASDITNIVMTMDDETRYASITCNNINGLNSYSCEKIYIPLDDSGYLVTVYFKDGNFFKVNSKTAGNFPIATSSSITFNNFDCYKWINNEWTNIAYTEGTMERTDFTLANVVYSSSPIYDENGIVVFPKAPQVPEITKVLVEQTTKSQVNQQLQNTIKSFLKYLVVLVVSLLAFWKGWRLLSNSLRKA